jgi:hypothetical protein
MRNRPLLVLAIVSALALIPAREAAGQVRIKFGKGGTATTVLGSVRGDASKAYIFGAKAGQVLTIDFRPSKGTLYYNVTKAGESQAMRNGTSTSGNPWTITLPSDGDYVIDVYFVRSEPPRADTATFTLKMTVDPKS